MEPSRNPAQETTALHRTKPPRPSWDEYFMRIAHEVATRSTCPRLAVGAVVVRDKRILTTGYNGSPAGMPHCDDVGCLIRIVDGRGELPAHAPRRAERHHPGGVSRGHGAGGGSVLHPSTLPIVREDDPERRYRGGPLRRRIPGPACRRACRRRWTGHDPVFRGSG